MVSLDYTAKAESVPAARTEGSVQSRPKGRSSTAANDALRKQFTGGRPTSVVKATGTPVVIGRIEPRRREPRIGWWLALGGLAAAAAIAGVILYLVRV